MAHVERRGARRWRARYRGPDGDERSKTFTRRHDAETWLATVETARMRGDWIDPSAARLTFREWAPQWLSESVHLKPSTIASYESILERHLLPRWGNVALGRIERPAVRSWIAKLSAEGMGAGTLKNVVNTFKAALSAAVESGLIVVSPAARVRLPHPVRAEKTFLTAEEVGRLAAEAPTEYRTLILFAAYSGLRAGEIAALRWERVDLRRATVEVIESYAEVHGELVLGPTKTYCRRVVRLPRFLCDLLEEHQAEAGGEGLVFHSPTGAPFRHSNFYRRIFRPAVAKAGLSGSLRFHDLRHTCVALLIAQGAHPMAIKERLGHSSITVTIDTYGGLFPALDESLADGLDATFRASMPNFPRPGRGLRLVTDSGEGEAHTPSPARSMVGLPGLEPGTFGPPGTVRRSIMLARFRRVPADQRLRGSSVYAIHLRNARRVAFD